MSTSSASASLSSATSTISTTSATSSMLTSADDSHSFFDMSQRKHKYEANATMRELMKPWGSVPESPNQCRAIMHANWARFSASTVGTVPAENMKVSILWTARATTPDFNPPLHERVYLGVDQPQPPELGVAVRKRGTYRTIRRPQALRRKASPPVPGAITFAKLAVKPVTTNSLITASMHASEEATAQSHAGAASLVSKALGKPVLSASMLPSAFDSDSEDEDEG